MQKQYKSLQDVYLAESFAKAVPPLPRQTILGEESKARGRSHETGEQAQYYLSGLEPERVYRTTQDFRKKNKDSYIFKNTKDLAYELPAEKKKGEDELSELALDTIKGSIKSKGALDAANSVKEKIRSVISKLSIANGEADANIINKTLKTILIKLADSRNKIKELPPLNVRFNLIDYIENQTRRLFGKDIIRALCQISGKGSVALGEPEFAITIFFDKAQKASKGGDIKINKIDIGDITFEVKGDQGRMGKGSPDKALAGIKAYMNLFYKKYQISKEYELIGKGGSQLAENLKHASKEILNTEGSTIQDIFELILAGTPKHETPENIVSDFISSAQRFNKQQINDETVIYLSTALQLYTYQKTDGHNFDRLWAWKNDYDSYITEVKNFKFIDYYNDLVKNFDVSKPASDNTMETFGITLK